MSILIISLPKTYQKWQFNNQYTCIDHSSTFLLQANIYTKKYWHNQDTNLMCSENIPFSLYTKGT